MNGIFVDEDRGIVFFTNHSQGELWRVDVAATEEPTLVASVDGRQGSGRGRWPAGRTSTTRR